MLEQATDAQRLRGEPEQEARMRQRRLPQAAREQVGERVGLVVRALLLVVLVLLGVLLVVQMGLLVA